MSSPVRIFLLEDDHDLRHGLASILELNGYLVNSAENGPEAVAKAVENPFDIFVFDIKLPGPDGLEVLAQFKKENPELLSVVMTGYATEKDTLRALRLGVGDYLKKPFRSKVLLDAVRRLESEVFRRRQLEERERSARALVVWSLEFLVGGLEFRTSSAGLSFAESARVAHRTALALGHSSELAQELQAAVLLGLLERYGEDGPQLTSVRNLLPESCLSLTAELGRLEESPKLEEPTSLAAVGLVCLSLPEDKAGLSSLEDMAGLNLQSHLPRRQDRERRQLLAVARTLLASGEKQAAREALTKLADTRSKEAGVASLELAKLAWAAGENADIKQHLRHLLSLLPLLGPQASAELELEAGFAALGMGLTDGRSLLERSQEKLQRLGLHALYSQSVVGLACAENSWQKVQDKELDALQYLMEHGLGEHLLSYSWWMLRPLLSMQLAVQNESLKALLMRLVQDATRSVGRTLCSKLPEAELSLLLNLVEEVGSSALEPSLQRLFAQVESPELKRKVESILSSFTQQEAPTLRLYSLGPFEVWIGDHRLSQKSWRTSRSRFLLASLAARQGRPLLAETLIEQFWPGVRPESGKKNLSQTASDLRKALHEAGFEPADEIVFRKHEVIALNQEMPIWHDLDAFREEMERGKAALEQGKIRSANQHLRQAYSLIRGEYLEDCTMEWALTTRRELERASHECCQLLATTCQQLELYPEVIEVANRVLENDPCHQPIHLLIMEAQSAMGRPELALRQFESARTALQVELGVEPSTDLLRAQQIAKMSL